MSIYEKIRDEKGEDWDRIQKVDSSAGTAGLKPQHIAYLVYHHFLESEDGQRRWDADFGDDDEKVEGIFDSIRDRYVDELEWIAEEEFRDIEQHLYNMVQEGVL